MKDPGCSENKDESEAGSLGANGDGGDHRRRPDRGIDRPGPALPKGLAGRVVGIGRDRAKLEEARRLGAVDLHETDPARGARPGPRSSSPAPRSPGSSRTSSRPPGSGPDSVLVTDAGSTKARIVEEVGRDPSGSGLLRRRPPDRRVRAARAWPSPVADLFEGRTCVLTPTPLTPPRPGRPGPSLLVRPGLPADRGRPPGPRRAARPDQPPAPRRGRRAGRLGPGRRCTPTPPGPTATGPGWPGPTPSLWAGIFRREPRAGPEGPGRVRSPPRRIPGRPGGRRPGRDRRLVGPGEGATRPVRARPEPRAISLPV